MGSKKESALRKDPLSVCDEADKSKNEGFVISLPPFESNLFTSNTNQQPSSSHQNGQIVSQRAHVFSLDACCSNDGDIKEVGNQVNSSMQDQCLPSTSRASESNCEQNLLSASAVSNDGLVDSRKRPSSLNLNNINEDDNDSSSDTGNEEYSLGSEDGCIYTYRGGEHLADLPSSFFSLDMGVPQDNHLPLLPNYPARADNAPAGNREGNSRASSPDMDFLEMDFDPGPSCEADTGDELSPDINLEGEIHMPVDEEPVLVRELTPEVHPIVVKAPIERLKNSHNCHIQCDSVPSTSRGYINENSLNENHNVSFGKYTSHVNVNGDRLFVRRTCSRSSVKPLVSFYYRIGQLDARREISPIDEPISPIREGGASATISQNHPNVAKKFIVEKQKLMDTKSECLIAGSKSESPPLNENGDDEPIADTPNCMFWKESEAQSRLETQKDISTHEARLLLNVFDALGVPIDRDKIIAALGPKRRVHDNAPLPRYLFSRTVEGYTTADIISSIHKVSEGRVAARFFPTYPERALSLSHWLADWIAVGAVPILTKNTQNICDEEIRPSSDGWEHRMVFGVSPEGIHLCNPTECVMEDVLWPQLISPPTLLVHVNDLWERFTPQTDLTPLAVVPDRRYHSLNVLGQVVNVIRSGLSSRPRGSYVSVPSSHGAGVAVAARAGSPAHRRLLRAAL